MALSAVRSPSEPALDLERVYRAHSGFVWRALRRFGVDDEDLEDLVHAVFLIVRDRLPTFEGRSALTSWLYGIARGVALNYRRQRHRRAKRERSSEPPGSSLDPEEQVSHRQAHDLVTAFLQSLPIEQRQVFALCELEGLSGPAVAEALALPINTVYSRLRLARRRFNVFVEEHA